MQRVWRAKMGCLLLWRSGPVPYVTCISEKKEEIWLSLITKAPTATEKSKKQRLRTDLARSLGVKTVTPLMWFNQFTNAQPSLAYVLSTRLD